MGARFANSINNNNNNNSKVFFFLLHPKLPSLLCAAYCVDVFVDYYSSWNLPHFSVWVLVAMACPPVVAIIF